MSASIAVQTIREGAEPGCDVCEFSLPCKTHSTVTGYQWEVLHGDGGRAHGKAKTRDEAWAAAREVAA